MARTVSRRYRLIAPVVGMTAALLLSGCAAGKIAQTQNQVPAIDGANGQVAKVGIRNAHFATTEGLGYQPGDTIPLYFYVTNIDGAADSLVTITSPVAQGFEITGDTTVRSQGAVEFAEDAAVTATLVGLTEEFGYGTSIPVTFEFASAGPLTLNVPIAIPEQRTDVRPTVNILPEHEADLWFGEEHGEGHEEGTH